MFSVACVLTGNYLGRGPEYVACLEDGVRRNLQKGFPGRFVCFTDDPGALAHLEGVETRKLPPGLYGWWNKLYLFSPDAFPKGERVLYFDLDTAITGPLDVVASYKGEFAILRDAYRQKGLQSSVMAWEAGNATKVFWERWEELKGRTWPGGDQQYIEHLVKRYDLWQEVFPGKFKSYKTQARMEIPRGCSVVFFHGEPRPHEVKEGWVPHVWKVGGGSGLEFIVQSNVDDETLRWNVRIAKQVIPRWLEKKSGHARTALIVGGGPSLTDELFRIRGLQMAGAKVFACNNTGKFLLLHDIKPDAQVLLDAREENAEFVLKLDIPKYVASQCHYKTLQAAGDYAVGFHAAQTCYDDLTREADLAVGGGTTVGLKAIAIAYLLGYRTFQLFGFDSCYSEGKHHAYPQSLNDKERLVEVKLGEATFLCAPWMVTQAEEFKELVQVLVGIGCVLNIRGEGLIPAIAASLQTAPTAADVRVQEIFKRLNGSPAPIGVEVGVFAGAMSVRLLSHPTLRLYMVDSWAQADPGSDYAEVGAGDFHAQLTQAQQDSLYKSTLETVSFAGDRAQVMRLSSTEAAEKFENESLDFVFIDADHSYEAVKADIAAWWPKVRKGGFLSGHDYDNPDFPLWGVKRAVTERFGSVDVGENFCWFKRKES